jgi:hypothetical protein
MELTKEVKINRKIQGDNIDNSCKLKQKFGLFRNFLFTAQHPQMAENIFQNAAYRATVYRTGVCKVALF